MKLRHIEVLHALMTTGSVTGASRLLHVSQPAVSKTLQHAESQLGFALFRRNRGRLRPTDEALALYAEIVKVQPQIDSIRRLAENLRRGTGRQLRVLTIPALAQTVIPRAIAEFREAYADCEIVVRAGHSRQIIAALLLHEADIAFDFGTTPHPGISRTPLLEAELVCVARHGWYPRGKPLPIETLARKPVTHLAEEDPLGERVFSAAVALGKPLRRTVAVDTYHAALALATAGVGAALIDPFTATSRNPEKVNVHPLVPPTRFKLCWFTAPDRPPNAMARRLVMHVEDMARKMLETGL